MNLSLSGLAQVEGGLRNLRGGLSSIHTAMRRVTAIAPALAGAFSATAIVSFAKNAINAADAMGMLAQRSGQSSDGMSRWLHTASLADVEADSLKVAMRDLTKHLEAQGVHGSNLSAEMLKIADRMKNAGSESERLAIATRLPGRQWQTLIPLLSQGSAELLKQMKVADRLGIVISDDFARDADAFNDNLHILKEAGQGFWLQVADNILPTLVKLSDRFVQLAVDSSLVETGVLAMTGAFAKLKDTSDLLAGVDKGWIDKIATALKVVNPSIFLAEAAIKRLEQRGRLARLQAQLERGIATDPKPDPGASSDPLLLRKEFDAERRLLDLKIAENQLITEKIKLEAADGIQTSEQIERLRKQFVITEQLIEQKRALTSTAVFRDKSVSPEDGRQFEVQDKGQLQGVDAGRRDLQDPNSVLEQTRTAMRALRVEFGTLAQQIARGFTGVIKSAVDSVASSISGLIMGTMTWADALRNVAGTILSSGSTQSPACSRSGSSDASRSKRLRLRLL